MHKQRQLVLENGMIIQGNSFGGDHSNSGELVYFTGVTGYQEMITDPSYFGKIVVMTYPSIGNYGINRHDFEAIAPYISGLIVKDLSHHPSNFRSEETLHSYLKDHGIPGISGVDTRMLTNVIRENGMLRARMMDDLVEINEVCFDSGDTSASILQKVSIERPYIIPGKGKRIVVMDFGVKQSILQELTARNCHITVVPYHYTFQKIVKLKPDGILLSNGPGNPAEMVQTIQTVRELIGRYALFGIGLGHQLIAHAYGVSTKKHDTGQYGVQFPIKDVKRDKVWFTTNSYSYFVEEPSLTSRGLHVTYRSLFDGTVAGFEQMNDAVLAVQFHPGGNPGSDEMNDVFDVFLEYTKLPMGNGGRKNA